MEDNIGGGTITTLGTLIHPYTRMWADTTTPSHPELFCFFLTLEAHSHQFSVMAPYVFR